MKKIILLIFVFSVFFTAGAKEYTLSSPNNKISIKVNVASQITWSVYFGEDMILTPSPVSVNLNDKILGVNARVKRIEQYYKKEYLNPVVRVKSAEILNEYKEMKLFMKGDYSLVFRLYDDAVAYRWITNFDGVIRILSEQINFCFPGDFPVWFPEEESMFTHQEREYKYINISEIGSMRFSSIPVLIESDNNIKILITEADLQDYPGFYLSGNSDNPHCLSGNFPYYPKKVEQSNDRNVKVVETEDYLALCSGSRSFPWRLMIISEEDKDLIENQTVYKLSQENQLENPSWIKPGKVAWDWWNANNVYDVGFEAGINTETYKHYIDFAAEYGIEYIIMDEGWYELGDLMQVSPEIDMEELTSYAKQKNVGIILWVIWKTLDDQLDEALEQFEKWEIKGIKVDFMQRDDQWMVNYYWRIAKAAADHHLLVDFHGSYKPSGLRRAYPNVLTREGVRGLEWSKWSDGASPENAVTIPFIRMLAGPLDYTPGAMINATESQFKAVYSKPMSQGTRCQQMAMYVVYESPLQMLADSPTHYMKEEECMEFLTAVPTVWDETVVLDASVGNFVLLARRSGNEWYIGAMTDWDPRGLKADLSFLHDGEYILTSWQDGFNADRNAEDYKKSVMTVTMDDVLDLKLAPGGGWVGRIVKGAP